MSRRRQADRFWVHSDPEPPAPLSETPRTAPCPGTCNAAYRRATRAATQEVELAQQAGRAPNVEVVEHGIEPRPGDPVWCPDCRESIRVAIGQLPELAGYVIDREDGRLSIPAGVDTGPQHTKGSHSPSGSPAWDTADEAITWANDTAHSLALHLGHTWRPRLRVDDTPYAAAPVGVLTHATRYLTTWCTSLLQLPHADQWGHQALSLATRLRRASGRDELVHRLLLPCPRCERKGLERKDGSSTVACRRCGSSWPESDYERLTVILADEERRALKAKPRKKAQ